MKKTCIMVYGRFNPVHKGHVKMFNAGLNLKNQIPNSDFKIFMSTTQDYDTNPLPYSMKKEMIDYYFPQFTEYVQQEQSSTLFGNLEILDRDYDSLILLCGSDRNQHFNSVLNKYNGTLYTFDTISVYNIGVREDSPYSSTVMRKAIRELDYDTFSSCLTGTDADWHYYCILTDYMVVEDDI